MEEHTSAAWTALCRIAQALDIPVEQFSSSEVAQDILGETSECLQLWLAIKTPDGRRRALENLRTLADGDTP